MQQYRHMIALCTVLTLQSDEARLHLPNAVKHSLGAIKQQLFPVEL